MTDKLAVLKLAEGSRTIARRLKLGKIFRFSYLDRFVDIQQIDRCQNEVVQRCGRVVILKKADGKFNDPTTLVLTAGLVDSGAQLISLFAGQLNSFWAFLAARQRFRAAYPCVTVDIPERKLAMVGQQISKLVLKAQ